MAGKAGRWIVLVGTVALTGLAPAEARAVYLGDFCWTLKSTSLADSTVRVALDQVNPARASSTTIWDASVRVRFVTSPPPQIRQLVGAGSISTPPGGGVAGPYDFGFQATGEGGALPITCVFYATLGPLPSLTGTWIGSCMGVDATNQGMPGFGPWKATGNGGGLTFSGVGTCPATPFEENQGSPSETTTPPGTSNLP